MRKGRKVKKKGMRKRKRKEKERKGELLPFIKLIYALVSHGTCFGTS